MQCLPHSASFQSHLQLCDCGALAVGASRHGAMPLRSSGALLGVAAGFTSQVAHAGTPPFQMWVLPKGLAPPVLIGTTAIFFGVINWLKVPAYFALGQFTHENLLTSAVLAPLAIAATFAGVWLVRRVNAEKFYTLIYVLMILVGAQLLWEATSR